MKNQIKTAIIEMLRQKGSGRTFAELDKLPGFHGDFGLETSTPNLFWWFSCTIEAVDAIRDLKEEKIIDIRVTSAYSYHADGSIPAYRIGKVGKGYKAPRWLPVGINKGPKFI